MSGRERGSQSEITHPRGLLSGNVPARSRGRNLEISVYLSMRANGWIDEWVGGRMSVGERWQMEV